MAHFVDTVNVKVAAGQSQHFDLSHKTITTQDFSVLTPISVKEVIPGDTFTVKISSFVRLAPLPCPTYGDINLITRCFYVPYRLIFKGFPNFITGTPYQYANGQVSPTVPQVSPRAMYLCFVNTAHGLTVETSGSTYDFSYNSKRYKLTNLGKRYFNLLVSLGYQVYYGDTTEYFSLLPLLAYAKVYFDWYYPSQFVDSSGILYYFDQPNLNMTSEQSFFEFLERVPVYETLEKDYFTTAFLEPNGLNTYQKSIDIRSTQFGSSTNNQPLRIKNGESAGQPYARGPLISSPTVTEGISILSQYSLDTLKAVDDVVKRNQISGNRYNEQLLTRYGIKIDNLIVGRSEYLGYTKQRIQIGEVMSTSDTSNPDEASNLGDYAGRGVGSSVSSFHLNNDANEFGILLTLSCIQVTTGYPYGYKRELVKHLDRFDFFTPEFDTLGTQPISRGELFSASGNANLISHYKPDSIFGWSPRYSEYKSSMDNLHGDFIVSAFKTGMDSWHLYRSVDSIAIDPDLEDIIPNMTFLSGDPNSSLNSFDRIFTVSQGQDHFICVHDVNIQAHRRMKSLSDSFVTEGSNSVQVGYNGSNL